MTSYAAPRRSDLPPELGVHLVAGGADVAVYAGHAEAVELCLFVGPGPDATERRVELVRRTHGVWHGHVPGVVAGQRYGYRVHGPWDPKQGLRYNPSKLLLDPYARAVEGQVSWRPEVYGHVVGPDLRGDHDVRDDRDSARLVPRGVVVDDGFDWGGDRPPDVPWTDTVVYEAHVRGLTRRHPAVPQHLRGTYAGLAHPATIDHLTSLGVTTVELLPVHTFAPEPALVRSGMTNYWGYNSLGFFAPHAAYAAASAPADVLAEFKGMVRLLHAAGIEVLLDVVYNHTCEQGRDGPTLSWRGLDQRAYYRLDHNGRDVDVTGCGNTLDFRHPRVVQMALDSLRYWVTECHVDGFRFDLATTLGRGRDDSYDPDHPFLVALRTDPLLSRTKLVAEPWDLGSHGWRTGQFPPPFGEWNDLYRDGVRTFWLADARRAGHRQQGHGVRDLATRLAGSADLFGRRDRGTVASINYLAAHDGFSLADTTAYEHKHNLANGEGNRDGHDDNRSWNHGTEGPTDDVDVLAARRRSLRNLLATIALSQGVPMLCAGDEMGRTQRGNNNAYCRDDDISWLDWDLGAWQQDLLATTSWLLRLRREMPALRRTDFLTGREVDEGHRDVDWLDAEGEPLDDEAWHDPWRRTLVMRLGATTDGVRDGSDSLDGHGLLVVLHSGEREVEVSLPKPEGTTYTLLWDSGRERPDAPSALSQNEESAPAGSTVVLPARTLAVWTVRRSRPDRARRR